MQDAVMTDDTPATQPDPEQVLTFPDGIPGFPGCHRFALLDFAEDSAFQLLQSLDNPEVSMVVSVPWLFFPEYAPVLEDSDQRDLEIEEPEDAAVFCPVTLDAEEETVYVNLLGPFIVNVRSRKGRQVVLADPDLPVRAPVPLGR